MKHLVVKAGEMKNIAKRFARELQSETNIPKPLVVALHGPLGSGKTTFAQGFLRGLGITKVVTSPTFLIMKKYALKDDVFNAVYHMDFYRIKTRKELSVLGIKEILQDSKNIILIEWPKRVSAWLPKNAAHVTFEHVSEEIRSIAIQP